MSYKLQKALLDFTIADQHTGDKYFTAICLELKVKVDAAARLL